MTRKHRDYQIFSTQNITASSIKYNVPAITGSLVGKILLHIDDTELTITIISCKRFRSANIMINILLSYLILMSVFTAHVTTVQKW